MRESSSPFLMLVELDRSKHGLVRQYAAVPLTACYLLHLVEEYSTCVGMNRANIWTRGMTKSPLRVERPTQKRLSRMRRKRRFAIMETGMESLP